MDTFFVIRIEAEDGATYKLGPYLTLAEASILMVDSLDRVIAPYLGRKFQSCKVALDECCIGEEDNWFVLSTRLVEVR